MSKKSCIATANKLKFKLNEAEFRDLVDACMADELSQTKQMPPLDPPPPPRLPSPPEHAYDPNAALAVGGGLGATGIALGAAAVVGVAGITVLGMLQMALLIGQPSNVTTSFQRDASGNVTSQTTTVT
jgi:hypothetical protein